ncbi:MAG: DinB family protein [Pyrinomonadaceae bacterium]
MGFHLKHIHGSIDRLLTYADARPLSEQQIKALAAETAVVSQAIDSQILLKEVLTRISEAVAAIRFTKEADLLEPRAVGRAKLPTNVLGLLFHLAEHTQRHTGQIIATATIARGMHS